MSTLNLEHIKHENSSTNNITVDSDGSVAVNRHTSDGAIVDFQKDGTTVGSIGVDYSTRMYIGTGTAGVFFNSDVPTLQPYSITSGDVVDNSINLGASASRFKDLYLSGGVYVGGTGSANYLDDYEEGTFTPELRASGGSNPTVNYSTQSGFYIKIGHYVFVSINLNWASQSGGTGLVRFGNLPITPSANSLMRSLGTIPYIDCLTGLTNAYGMLVHTAFAGDTNGPYLYYTGSGGNINAYVNIANVASSGAIQICLGYYAA